YTGLSVPLILAPHEESIVYFTLSEMPFVLEDGEEALARAKRKAGRLPKITLGGEYGELSKWLVQQVWNSRFAGRTGFYQVSGAYGFRDQLQDCLALLYADPASVRAHLLECAQHQFKAGDVQHWWHPPAVGVRTHVCDDRLWLVYVACVYALQTGDDAVFSERVPFLNDVPIQPTEATVYAAANVAAEKESLYEHCLRALAVVFDRGVHGLILLRGGDWLDALDVAGKEGKGESVWCTMFAVRVLTLFLRHVKDEKERELLGRARDELQCAAQNAFYNDRFLRAVTDDGTVLGAPSAKACKIDLLAQSFATLCDIGTREQQQAALTTAYNMLVDEEKGIISLFDPPFTSPDGIGYLGKYPPYVRENGGQYTQAAVWYVFALFKAGETEKANKLLSYLSPIAKCATKEGVAAYGGEPYVTASDVYGGAFNGYAGWTWYTGSASWLYKLLIEQYAGITVRGSTLIFDPHLPQSTPSLTVTVLYENERIEIEIVNSKNSGDWRVRIGGVVYNTPQLRLHKGLAGKRIAVVRLPNK
ncbi:MAG: hypothetical protein K2M95_02775, partial [Clostridiales bacterium]|nr:hypothetical protein [Clostridiales bacterium]